MTLDQAITHYGTIARLARALETTTQTVYNWRTRGAIPGLWQYKLECLTAGQLRAGSVGADRDQAAP
jgi:hypothetical protein